jgi:2,3-bisphosphoglycerate-dependent phosphoglycerate mutase
MEPLVLLRHGQSEWNLEGRFAGWVDVALTSAGVEQARRAGRFLRQQGFDFDCCYTSVLKRATHTAWECLDARDRCWLPTERSWRLNERHYGALHGLRKAAVESEFGAEQLRLWRRSFGTRPPASAPGDRDGFLHDPRYAAISVPSSESLADTVDRVLPFWKQAIRPMLAAGGRALVVAHGTSLRALIRILCNTNASEIAKLEVPNGVPLIVEFDAGGHARPPYCLHE